MTAVKYLFLIGGIFLGLGFLMMAGIGLLLLEQANENGEGFKALLPSLRFSFPFGGGEVNEGNEFTGQTSGWLFGIACLPVVFHLATRFLCRRVPLLPGLKGLLERLGRVNKKFFMPFHTYLSILALFVATVHLLFSSCPNPLPEWGLIIAGILVATGLIIKLRFVQKISPKLVKWVYQFHASLVVSGILGFVLLAGHVLMD